MINKLNVHLINGKQFDGTFIKGTLRVFVAHPPISLHHHNHVIQIRETMSKMLYLYLTVVNSIWMYSQIEAFVCPSGAKEVGGICIRYHEGSYHWSQARNECKRRYGTDLLVIRNNAVFRDVQNAVQGRGDHGFWVGAKGSGGSFTWVNHQPCCGGYWNPGEPNGDGNDCVHVWDSQPDKGLNDVPCDDPIGYICEECPEIDLCEQRHCTQISDTVCDKCIDDNVFYKRTHLNTKCERMCSFDDNPCWPGRCSNELTTSCSCAPGFVLAKNSSQTMCQLSASNTPSINNCQTRVGGVNGEAKRTTAGKCQDLKDFYGNFQPTTISIDMQSDFIIDVTAYATKRPKFISEEKFGISDTSIYLQKEQIDGRKRTIETQVLTSDRSHSENVKETDAHESNFTLPQPEYKLANGERLCIQFEAKGGGYVKRKDFRGFITIKNALPYTKTSTTETICYRYDDSSPEHCLEKRNCIGGETEPLQISNRITRSPIIPVTFSGWMDPIPRGGNSLHASQIESYEITVNEVSNGLVDTKKVYSTKVNVSGSVLTKATLNLTSDTPRLYSITLEVKDVADNVRQARRFVLYDNTTSITSRADKPFTIVSASIATNYTWQTHHNDICLNWKDYFFNKYYMVNQLLGKINPDSHGLIKGIYEQNNGVLPVSGTPNVHGITGFKFSWGRDGVITSSDTIVPKFLQQSYCHSFNLRDGQIYNVRIEAIDIVNNTHAENRTVYIDRSVPHINNIWLMKNGVKRLFVHDGTDLSKMNLTFEALDPHSGLLNIEWTFETMDPKQQLGTGVIGVSQLEKESCPKNLTDSCYCPDIGKCEDFKYSIPLNKLVHANKHIGNHNRNYVFTIKVTNNAKLWNIEQVDILVDDSPPEIGVVYEGSVGTQDIDYTSDDSFIVRWHGFIDHESGIKEYRLGLADICFDNSNQLLNDSDLISEFTTVLHTETSIRLKANFTGKKYVNLIAINNALEPSNVACSDGITKDNVAPSIRNISIEHGKWSESITCLQGNAWLLTSDLRKERLPDSTECTKRCANDTLESAILELLPNVAGPLNNDTDIGDFLCKKLPRHTYDTIIYLPNDRIVLNWDIAKGLAQIEDFTVGLSQTSGHSSALDIMDFEPTNGKQFFHMHHIGVGSGDLFYIHVKAISKAHKEAVSVIGPIMIDETPPYFKETPSVTISGDKLLVGWKDDSIFDLEQNEKINQIFFQIVHDGITVTPLLEWRLDDAELCSSYPGGCFRYPLEKLQRIDTDKGLHFAVRLYAYNNAGHFTINETESFQIPSRYPPGQAVVKDIDPARTASSLNGNYRDVDVHFKPNTICSQWIGFKHHEQIHIEIGIGTDWTQANVIPFQYTNNSKMSCISSPDIHFDTKYFVLLRASCSGGNTTSTSNGLTVLNKTDLLNNINIKIGHTFTNISTRSFVNGSSQEICFTGDSDIGARYELYLYNASFDLNITSNDIFEYSKMYDRSNKRLKLEIIPFIKRPCMMISSDISNTVFAELRKKEYDVVNGNRYLYVSWSYKASELLQNLQFKVALASFLDSKMIRMSSWQRSSGHTTHVFAQKHIFNLGNTYAVALMSCTNVFCLNYTLSRHFKIERNIKPEKIEYAALTVEGNNKCIATNISWRKFESMSEITIYQWSLSRDKAANDVLTEWKVIKSATAVEECVLLPVHGHTTLFACIRAYSTAGNVAIECTKASTIMKSVYDIDTVYDMDIGSNSWQMIKEMLHSSNLGSKMSLLHDREVDFGTSETLIAGVLMHATDRNVTWFLKRTPELAKSIDCDKDKDCVHSAISDNGFMPFDMNLLKRNEVFYICAYSNMTLVPRESFEDILPEIKSCSNGFIIDDVSPTLGKVFVKNFGGYLTESSKIDIYWKGFDDNTDVNKLGYRDRIKYYSYSIGNRPSGTEVKNETVIGNTHSIVEHNVTFTDGTDVYVTITVTDQAGLSSSVSSMPLVVDTSPPETGAIIIESVLDRLPYLRSPKCKISLTGFKDHQSGIKNFEVGVGSDDGFENILTGLTYDTDHFEVTLPAIVEDGRKNYISVKAVNRAGLLSDIVSVPFVLDKSPPTGGHVIDGDRTLNKDQDYQASLSYIQGHWYGFVDPQSGIRYYRVGLGSRPLIDDIENMVNVGLQTDKTWNGTYRVGVKYFITVEACNGAEACRTISSDGLMLDNSPPISGTVRVGSGSQHRKYLPHGGTIHIQYAGFEDPQSGIEHYETCIGTNTKLCDILPFSSSLLESSIIKTGLNLTNGIRYYCTVKAVNKVGMQVAISSDAFEIDTTAPVLVEKPTFLHLYNSSVGIKAQWDKSILHVSWKFEDSESKIASHIVSLKTHHEGHTPLKHLHVGNVDGLTINLNAESWLHNGDVYYIVVESCNVAGLCSFARSDNILIDSTPPHQGGFKPPMIWQNFIDLNNRTKSRLSLTWYGFSDAESSIDFFFLKVSKSYTGNELSQGDLAIKANDSKDCHVEILLNEHVSQDDLLILTLWANNTAGLNSTMARITVTALLTESGVFNSSGILEIQKHSCDVHFCNKDCTCAVIGQQCVQVHLNETCNVLSDSDVTRLKLPKVNVFGGLPVHPLNMTVSSACLSGHWLAQENEYLIQRYEWSMGIKDQPVGEGIFDLKSERPWNDVGKNKQSIYCLPITSGLQHDTGYIIYVRAWYSKNMYATFTSDPLYVDQTPPHVTKGKVIKDSDSTCLSDYDIIDWMDHVSACWNGVFSEGKGQVSYYTVSLGTSINGSDIQQIINVGLSTNLTLTNLKLSHGTKYFFTVNAYNNLGLHISVSSDGFLVDMDQPVDGIVFNTDKHLNTDYQSLNTSFSISWHGFVDRYSGIRSYHVALVTDLVLDYTNISFTNVGLLTKYIFRDIKLEHGKRYKGLVKAYDNAGHVSHVSESDPKLIDVTKPSLKTCEGFETAFVNHTSLENGFSVEIISDLSANDYYIISGMLTNFSIALMPVLTIGRHRTHLPVTINHNRTAEFQYSFMSTLTGMTNMRIDSLELDTTIKPPGIKISKCLKLKTAQNDVNVIQIKQMGKSQLAVNFLITDEESSLHKVFLGVGTTSDGFQVRPLLPFLEGASSVIDVEIEHNALVYATVVAENNAGLRAVFKGGPIKYDNTPPVITDLKTSIIENNNHKESNGTDDSLDIVVNWNVMDHESGVKYCVCWLGKAPSESDISVMHLSDSKQSCTFDQLNLEHGDNVYVSVKCINNVELGSDIVSDKIVISSKAPDVSQAIVRVISPFHDVSIKQYQEVNVTYIVADGTCIRLEWDGFQDQSGLTNYEYRITFHNDTVIDWKDSGRSKAVDIKGLSLDTGELYKGEVRAVNSGNHVSDPVFVGFIVQREPSVTGKPVMFVFDDGKLKIDWSKVFLLDENVDVTYDVTVGTRHGFSDVLEMHNSDRSYCEIVVPELTIVTPKINELYVSITCMFSTGLFHVYDANYKI
ncbi:uncharacterized protein LOC132713433 isoform X3 [Ruditapes philippinarum]|uniref:uncharacterized protein LOC132713433 isoform X3 n=1 Tax=Ruditapes philippinarum TaxID=129788 RepID=UPI00295BB19D|nr:uncharacterized protein LOC132713433 isoform X3 [Ruditapes philippinarum]